MPKKGRIKRLDPIPGDPDHKMLVWEDLLTFREVSEVIPASMNMGQIKQYVRTLLKDMGPMIGEEVTD